MTQQIDALKNIAWNTGVCPVCNTQDGPAQPQQEPVAWASMLPNGKIGVVTWSKDTAQAWESQGDTIKELSFTSPPAQRKPKTEEFIKHAWANSAPNIGFGDFLVLFRAIEAAHGIKGDA